MGIEQKHDQQNSPSPYDETISGLGIWTGLLPVAREAHRAYGEERGLDETAVVERVDRQFERYQWFVERVDRPRSVRRLARLLANPPEQPSAWERAMVELSLAADMKAVVVLQRWEPPGEDLDLELFRRICLTRAQAGGPGE